MNSANCTAISRSPKLRVNTVIGVLLALSFGTLPLAAQELSPTVMAGTRLRVQFDSEVGTAISRTDDGVEVHLLEPVQVAGREALPARAALTGRVLGVRKGDKHSHTFPMLRLGFEKLTLPDGRSFSCSASLENLGITMQVDSEGAAMPAETSKGGDVAVPVTTGAAGAGVGAIAGGAKGAGVGAGIGAGIGILADLAARSAQWQDFTLKKGRKAWLRLDADLVLNKREEK